MSTLTAPFVAPPLLVPPADAVSYRYDAFISYHETDQDWVEAELLLRLRRAGVKAAIDWDHFVPGVPYLDNFEKVLRHSRFIVAVASDAWLNDLRTRGQGQAAQARYLNSGQQRLLPLRRRPGQEWPVWLATLPRFDFTDPARAEDEWRRLLQLFAYLRQNPDSESQVSRALIKLSDLLLDPFARQAVLDARALLERVSKDIEALGDRKYLHDVLHTLQRQCYLPILAARAGFPDDVNSVEQITDCARDLQKGLDLLRRLTQRPSFDPADATWVEVLEQARQDLQAAVESFETQNLLNALQSLKLVTGSAPPSVNGRLDADAKRLELAGLVAALGRIAQTLTANGLAVADVQAVRDGAASLDRIDGRLRELVATHSAWQGFDDLLRMIDASVTKDDLGMLKNHWAILKRRAAPLLGTASGADAELLRTAEKKLDDALSQRDPRRTLQAFRGYLSQAGAIFYKSDEALKDHCDDLRWVGGSLAFLVRVLSNG
jgi:hypothetical protein